MEPVSMVADTNNMTVAFTTLASLRKHIVGGAGENYLWLHWLQWGATFSQVVWLIGC
jgi:hypothetical protein